MISNLSCQLIHINFGLDTVVYWYLVFIDVRYFYLDCPGRKGGYSLIFAIWGHAAGQGKVFFVPSVLDRVYRIYENLP